jgi:hypothetical protein
MPIPSITALPVPPSRADATNFASRADAFFGALPTFQSQTNAAGVAINAVYFPPVLRNRIINGDFSIWQRGTSQTTSGTGSDDQWSNSNAGATKTHSRQAFTLGQTAVPGEPAFFSRTVVSSVTGATNLCIKQQRIEGVRTLAGRNARVSFWAKADANRQLAIDLNQFFGTGGSPSASVEGIGAQKFSVNAVWQKFTATIALPSIAGKTLGTNGNDLLEFTFWFDAGSNWNARSASLGHQSGTFDIALVQIEEGTNETPFEFRPPGVELALCQRYYTVLSLSATRFAATGGPALLQAYTLPTTMRTSPSASLANMQYYNGSVATAFTGDYAASSPTHVTVGSLSGLTNAQGIAQGTVALSSELL